MTPLATAILKLLTAHPAPADELIADLRAWQKNGINDVPPFQPGEVLDALDLLVLHGKAVQVKGEGYRLPPPKPTEHQRGMFA